MHIAVCDDDEVQLEYICSLVRNRSAQNHVARFKSAEELLFNYTPGRFDVLLLDIQMQGENGISLAKRIREFKDDATIVFITAVPDYVFEGYDVGAVQYLLKPVDERKLFDCLDTACEKTRDRKERVLFETDDGTAAVSVDDIVYIEAVSRKTNIVLSDKTLTVNDTLSDFSKYLTNDFYKCHRSYIVNLRHISSIKKYDAVMDNGATVPVSRRIYNDFNLAFISYYRKADD